MEIDYTLDGHENQSFEATVKVLPVPLPPHLAREGLHVFQSKSFAFEPIRNTGRTYGGHVMAQSCWAAAHTTSKGYVCHSHTSYFLSEGRREIPFIYAVDELRNGRNYLARECKVYQVPAAELSEFAFQQKYLIFVATMSFKLPQRAAYKYQVEYPKEYEASTEQIEEMETAPDTDTPMLIAISEGLEPYWHPLDVRKRDMTESNKSKILTDRRILHYFRSPFKLAADPNLHVAVLLWISDRNSLFTIINIQEDNHVGIHQIASLSNNFVLHNLDPQVDLDGWNTMETWSDRAYDARGLYNGRIFDSEKRLVCSFTQDGVV